MKLDVDLFRSILLAAEEQPAGEPLSDFSPFGPDTVRNVEHVQLLLDAGLVDGRVMHYQGGAAARIARLTLAGHEFLAQARNETLWVKTKQMAGKAGVGLTLEVLKELLPIAAREAIKGLIS